MTRRGGAVNQKAPVEPGWRDDAGPGKLMEHIEYATRRLREHVTLERADGTTPDIRTVNVFATSILKSANALQAYLTAESDEGSDLFNQLLALTVELVPNKKAVKRRASVDVPALLVQLERINRTNDRLFQLLDDLNLIGGE